VQGMLKMVAAKLNLAEHQCKGLKDISSSPTFAAAETQVYRNTIPDIEIGVEHYFVQNMWMTFPPEVPTETHHFIVQPREQRFYVL